MRSPIPSAATNRSLAKRGAELRKFGGVNILSLAHDDERLDGLPPLNRGHADDGALFDAGMTHQDRLDFRGSNILAAADDHVVLATGEKHVAVVVEPSEIAGRAPSVGQPRIVLAPGITLHDARGADNYLADFSVGQKLSVLVANANLDVRQRLAD